MSLYPFYFFVLRKMMKFCCWYAFSLRQIQGAFNGSAGLMLLWWHGWPQGFVRCLGNGHHCFLLPCFSREFLGCFFAFPLIWDDTGIYRAGRGLGYSCIVPYGKNLRACIFCFSSCISHRLGSLSTESYV